MHILGTRILKHSPLGVAHRHDLDAAEQMTGRPAAIARAVRWNAQSLEKATLSLAGICYIVAKADMGA